jgi:DNA helicase-2/ATP-dependent DNA helicase PcrA
MREFEEKFINLGVPYRIIGGPRFYERQEIRDVLAYLRVIYQPSDDLAFERIINTPKRGLAAATLQKLHAIARAGNCPLTTAAKNIVETEELRPKARSSLRALIENFDRWRALSDGMDHIELTENILSDSGYLDMWKNDKSPDAPGRLDNISEMIRGMDNFENLAEFLEHISLVMENIQDLSQDKVNIMTLHGSKGLEFECVFLPGWEEELFPSKKTLEESGEKGLEEERRLAYVGITRAKKQAHIFHVASRYMFGNYISPLPSRFIAELPQAHIEHHKQQGLGRGGNDFSDFGYTKNSQYNPSGYGKNSNAQNSYQLDRSKAKKTLRSSYQKPAAEITSNFSIGDRVFHDKFGYGHIIQIEGNKLEIDFESGSSRRVMEAFVTAS